MQKCFLFASSADVLSLILFEIHDGKKLVLVLSNSASDVGLVEVVIAFLYFFEESFNLFELLAFCEHAFSYGRTFSFVTHLRIA